MPRQDTLQITNRPAIDGAGLEFGTQVIAHPVDTFVDQGMDQHMQRMDHFLAAGQSLLGTINEVDEQQGAADAALGKEQQRTGIFGGYAHGYQTFAGAANQKQDQEAILADASADGAFSMPPDEYQQWKQKQIAKYTEGIGDGPYAKSYMDGFTALSAKMDQQYAQAQAAITGDQLEANMTSVVRQVVQDNTQPGVVPEDGAIAQLFGSSQKAGMGVSLQKFNQIVKAAFTPLIEAGRPEAFEQLKTTAADGRNLNDDPEMALWIAQSQKAAERQKHVLDERQAAQVLADAQPKLTLQLDQMNDDMRTGRKHYTPEEVAALVSPAGVFHTHTAAAGWLAEQRVQEAQRQRAQQGVAMIWAKQPLYTLTPEQRTQTYDALLGQPGGPRDLFSKGIQAGDIGAVSDASKAIFGVYQVAGTDDVDPVVRSAIKGQLAAVPSTDPMVQRRFMAAAEAYRAMPPNVQLKYAEGDDKTLLDVYVC